MYTLRYTNDLYVVRQSDNLNELKPTWSDYLMHIVDNKGEVVWQNAESARYGRKGM